MPELPEVETTKNVLAPYVAGKIVDKVRIYQPKLRWLIPQELQALLPGLSFQMIERRAKYLILYTAKGSLIFHLGMSGSLQVVPVGTTLGKHDHFEIIMRNGPSIRFNDPRRFGCILWTADRLTQHKLFKKLGCEPLEAQFTAALLFKMSRYKKCSIKQFIMDQKNVVGVGNIYACESLFLAKINPLIRAGLLNSGQCHVLVDAIKTVLRRAIVAGGTSLKDFVGPDGKPGIFAQQLFVYSRAGQPCLVCQTKISSQLIAQRNSFFCNVCQS
jgi:formamidopyrimidine-DNA glycosylase